MGIALLRSFASRSQRPWALHGRHVQSLGASPVSRRRAAGASTSRSHRLAVLAVGLGLVSAGGPVQAASTASRSGSTPSRRWVTSTSTSDSSASPATAGASSFTSPGTQDASGRLARERRGVTFEYIWYERRPDLLVVRDAHSLYMETFTELGVVGSRCSVERLLLLVVPSVRARRLRFAATGTWRVLRMGRSCDLRLALGDGRCNADGHSSPGQPGSSPPNAESAAHSEGEHVWCSWSVGVLLSVLAVWSLVGNQALFAGREALARKDWVAAREHARRAQTLLFWSAEPAVVLGDADAGLGERAGALGAYRKADCDGSAELGRLASRRAGGARQANGWRRIGACAMLNPREEGLPGE